MPPFLPRKRLATPDLLAPRKRTRLIDVLDADPGHSSNLQAAKNFTLGEEDSYSSLSDINSDGLEDVSPVGKESRRKKDDGEEDSEEVIDWEDAITERIPIKAKHVPMAGGNLELNLSRNMDEVDLYDLMRETTSTRKGPTKIEREIRSQTHRLHVQFLLYHNAVRNCWTCDRELQSILMKQLPPGIKKEIQKWRVASGLASAEELPSKDKISCLQSEGTGEKVHAKVERGQRDWGKPCIRLENRKPDLSRGDPIIPLLKILAAFWKKRFSVTAPGLRKIGYTSAAVRQRQIRSFQNEKHDPEKHGEKIESLVEFRKLARKCEGSRDVGAQLFTALLRGIGIESRLVANLQPSGFGWTRNEEAEKRTSGKPLAQESEESSSGISEGGCRSGSTEKSTTTNVKGKRHRPRKRKAGKSKAKGSRNDPVDLDTASAEESVSSGSDTTSVIDVTPTSSAQNSPRYDKDLPFPIYWTEAISPINSAVIPLSPLVLPNPVASTPEILSTFEPRGAKADKARQVMAYVVAYSADGSAKDVTTRYLKRRMWPGKTRGFRVPVEKVPIRDKRGKVKRYEEYDWFKSVMNGYVRTDEMRTAVDDVEEATDLVPQQPERKENKEEGDTLQSLKSSAEFVLERFLRREEALRPNAKPLRIFTTGKGERLKEENVYRRADVERCLSAESWHKEGRQIKAGEAPMKLVPIRAVTLVRKREVEEMQRQTGEKAMQGLYSRDQTEYIIPPPIKDGVIPRNSYGNIDCFVPSMVPKGAVHIPIRGTVKICKKLEIDYAEAVTGFEFGKKIAIPVIEGVVVAAENESVVRAAWQEHAEQQKLKEEIKLEKAVITLWKKMLMGLRIRERVSGTYGEDVEISGEVVDPVQLPGKPHHDALPPEHRFDDPENGWMEGIEDGGGFLVPQKEDDDLATWSGELLVEHHDDVPQKQFRGVAQYSSPISVPSRKVKRCGRNRKPMVEAGDSSELSEVGSVGSELDGTNSSDAESEDTETQRCYDSAAQSRGQITVEIPMKNRSLTKRQFTVLASVTSEPNTNISAANPGRGNNGFQAERIEPSEAAKGKRTSAKSKGVSSGLAASSERKLRPRRVAQHSTSRRSPYFDPGSDAEE